MNKFENITIIGGTPLVGEINVRGAKNLVSKAIVAALLTKEKSVLKNVPNISDVEIMGKLLVAHGVGFEYDPETGIVQINPSGLKSANPSEVDKLAGTSRIPILMCGPLLHMLQVAHIPALGGCAIGGRQINFHTQALELFGANVDATSKGVKLTSKEKLKGIKFRLDYPSVGATEQILMTAVLAEGITELSNAAIEPEILDLINILQKMGAIITVDTNRTIIIEGVESLYGYNHTALTDRIETASWASAALATDGNIFVKGAKQSDLTTFLNIYRKVGGDFIVTDDGIKFFRGTDNEGNALPLKSIALETDVHPGFATDWQQPLVVALTQAEGISVIHETVYEKRFGFINTLNKMGAKIQVYKECLGGKKCRFGYKNFEHSAVISGPSKLTGTDFEVPDLRGGFSYLIAALTADGVSHISNLQIINRGYENFEQKLRDINANFEF